MSERASEWVSEWVSEWASERASELAVAIPYLITSTGMQQHQKTYLRATSLAACWISRIDMFCWCSWSMTLSYSGWLAVSTRRGWLHSLRRYWRAWGRVKSQISWWPEYQRLESKREGEGRGGEEKQVTPTYASLLLPSPLLLRRPCTWAS